MAAGRALSALAHGACALLGARGRGLVVPVALRRPLPSPPPARRSRPAARETPRAHLRPGPSCKIPGVPGEAGRGPGWTCCCCFIFKTRKRCGEGPTGTQRPGGAGLTPGSRLLGTGDSGHSAPICLDAASEVLAPGPPPCPGARGLDAEGGWRLREFLPNRVSSVAFDGSAGAESQPSPAISWSLRCPVGKAGREVPDSGSLSNLTLSLRDEWPGV